MKASKSTTKQKSEFWNSKQPLVTAALQRLDLIALAKELNMTHALQPYLEKTLLDFSVAT
jgi:hypothetical protein